MLEINLSENQSYTNSSDKIVIVPNRDYFVSTEVIGIKGRPFSAYFGVILFDQKNQEILRKKIWLNDFSGTKKEAKVFFTIPSSCSNIQLIYDINNKTLKKSACHYQILPIEKATIFEANPSRKHNESLSNVLPTIPKLSEKEELTLENNLVLVLGAPRSGTSWLSTELLSHNNHTMNEPQIGRHLGFNIGFKDSLMPITELFYYEPDYFFSFKYSKTWEYYLRKLILHRLHAQFEDLNRKIIIKEPNGSIGANVLCRCLPNARIIVCLRDGRDVVDSRLDGVQPGGWSTRRPGKSRAELSKDKESSMPQSQRLAVIKFQSNLWNLIMKSIMSAYENHSEDRKLMIKYEELLSNTFQVLQKIYEFIQVQISEKELKDLIEKYDFNNIPDSIKGSGKFRRFAKVGLWKENLNHEEQILVNEIMGSFLQKLGY